MKNKEKQLKSKETKKITKDFDVYNNEKDNNKV